MTEEERKQAEAAVLKIPPSRQNTIGASAFAPMTRRSKPRRLTTCPSAGVAHPWRPSSFRIPAGSGER